MSLVRPHLEYANVVWGPFYKTDQQMIEKVQKRATKLIVTIANQTYEERLRHLNMPSLLHRRRRGDMIEMFKIMKGFVNTNKENYFEPAREVRMRGHQYKAGAKTSCKYLVALKKCIVFATLYFQFDQ